MNSNGIPTHPYLKPWYRIAQDEDRLILEYGQAVVVFEGKAVKRLLPALLPLLDGTRTIDEITVTLGHAIEPAIQKALSTMTERGLVVEGPPLSGDTPAPFRETAHLLAASRRTRTITEVQASLQRAQLGIAGIGVNAEELVRLLRRSGIGRLDRISEDDDRGDLTGLDLLIVAPPSTALARVAGWNRRALALSVPWLQVLPFDGKFAAIGPLFLPGETCCHECFRLRRIANLEYSEEVPALERSPAPYLETPSLGAAIAAVATTLALRWLAHGDRAIPGTFYALEYPEALKLSAHRVYRVPRCPVCSDVDSVAPPLPWYKEVRVGSR